MASADYLTGDPMDTDLPLTRDPGFIGLTSMPLIAIGSSKIAATLFPSL